VQRVRWIAAVEDHLAARERPSPRDCQDAAELGLGQVSEQLPLVHGRKCDGRDTRNVTRVRRAAASGRGPGLVGMAPPGKEQVMRRRPFRVRRWLVLAAAVSALVFASGAQARYYAGEDGVTGVKSAPVATKGAGFDWGYAMVGVGAGLVIAIVGVGLLQL